MKTIAYLKASTAQQDADSQRLVILECARKNGFRIDDFVEATARGQVSVRHRRLDELIGALKRGDRLVVSELSRLGRSLGQVVAVLDGLVKAGVLFIAIKGEHVRRGQTGHPGQGRGHPVPADRVVRAVRRPRA